ncbi:hypothetical protein O6H91_01G039600 [Diphasiastrum complanatum]|uniref:Uncharacterized protein n=3 Tax=Diphasiastrum complanatum TaxID=34168 RepID=A0ACC2EQC3_DIPCM|nr:hypothetical protein O6H91_01G039600 [Diphasiastrum complanatum]KAJ7568599.1 hypothetical protein O6H91_01G039600 [Diphasiastrum complanatum]KAJ7568600.1 hypothetical protein O6H91_01G039600 [Diphasiastrum complanatum]
MRCILRFRQKNGRSFAFGYFLKGMSTEKPSADALKHQQAKEHTQIKKKLQCLEFKGSQVDVKTYAELLRACGNVKALADGQSVHAHIAKSRYAKNIYLTNLLIHMYGKCGCIGEARKLFDAVSSRDVVSWTAMIAAYAAQHGQSSEALELFRQMQCEGVQPNKITLVTALAACCTSTALAHGKHIHALTRKNGLESDVIVATALVKMYGKCGSLEDALRVFCQMPERNVISWTTMISAYIQHGQHEEALALFEQMQLSGLKPNKITYLSLLNACASLLALTRGKLIHAHILENGYELDVVLGTALVDMYGKCGSLEDALKTFYIIPERNVVTWTVLISAYAQHGHSTEALQYFEQMQKEGFKPNNVTVVTVLNACSNEAALEDGMLIHAWMIENGIPPSTVVCTALVDMYGKCGYISYARDIFDSMPERDMVTWNAMISVYSNNGKGKDAFLLFQQMQLEGVKLNKVTYVSVLDSCSYVAAPVDGTLIHDHLRRNGLEIDVVVGSALVNMYGNCGKMMEARRVFEMLPERNVVAWTAMISAYAQNKHPMEAIQLFHEMQSQGVKPNKVTFLSVLDACTNAASLEEGELIHSCIDGTDLESDVLVGTALVHMYRKCGCLSDARDVFDKASGRNLIIWTAIIAAYAQHGHGKEAVQLFGHMQWQGVKADEVAFVCLLSACSHTGMIDEGCHYFLSFTIDSSIRPTAEHYGCMIDLYGRAGRLNEAEKFIRSIPVKPDAVMLMALLGACRMYQDVPRGRRVAEELLKLDPDNEAAYVVLSNIYAGAGRWEDAETVRFMMAGRKGSMLESKHWVQKFVVKNPLCKKECFS